MGRLCLRPSPSAASLPARLEPHRPDVARDRRRARGGGASPGAVAAWPPHRIRRWPAADAAGVASPVAGRRRAARAAGRCGGRHHRHGREHVGGPASHDAVAVGTAAAGAARRPAAVAGDGPVGWRPGLPAGAVRLAAVGGGDRPLAAADLVGESRDCRRGHAAPRRRSSLAPRRRDAVRRRCAHVADAPRRALVSPRVAGGTARMAAARARRPGLVAVPGPGGCRRSRDPTARRGAVRRRCAQPPRRVVCASGRGAQADRRRHRSARVGEGDWRCGAAWIHADGIRSLARDRPRQVPADLLGRALRRRRHARQPVCAEPAGSRSRAATGPKPELRVGRLRRGAAVRGRRTAHAARRARHLRS